MLKKIILGLIIGAVVLTGSAGALYAYQKNSVADTVSTAAGQRFGQQGTCGNEENCYKNENCDSDGDIAKVNRTRKLY